MIDYADLTDAQKEELLKNGMTFMRTITEIWGAEQGMLLWEKIGEGISQDLKGALFFAMLTGEVKQDVKLSKIDSNHCVDIVKAIRYATGASLKEAKDVYDTVRDKGAVSFFVPPDRRSNLVQDLRGFGCDVR